jgi:hypothetical protein
MTPQQQQQAYHQFLSVAMNNKARLHNLCLGKNVSYLPSAIS